MREESEALLLKKIVELRQEEERAGAERDYSNKRLVSHKRRYLSRLAINKPEIFPDPTVFISFSERGRTLGDRAISALQKKQVLVRTGLDRDVQAKSNVLSAVKGAIRDSSMFLGIWSAEYKVIDKDNTFAAPSVWLLEEKGMAQAFNKPLRLLVESTIHTDFWLKTTPDKLQHKFDSSNFEEKLGQAIDALIRRYHEKHVAVLIGEGEELD